MEGLNGRSTGNAELKIWTRPPTSPSSAHLPLTTAMPNIASLFPIRLKQGKTRHSA